MKKIWYGLMACAILEAGGCAVSHHDPRTAKPLELPAARIEAFAKWPAGKSPAEVGKKLSARMLTTRANTQPGAHYAEDSLYMTTLKFAALTKDEQLMAALVKRFDPVMTPAAQTAYQAVQRHVDHNI